VADSDGALSRRRQTELSPRCAAARTHIQHAPRPRLAARGLRVAAL